MKNYSRVSSVSYEALASSVASVELTPEVYENMTATGEKAPYLLRVIPNGEVDRDGHFLRVSAVTGHTFEETRREHEILMETVIACLREGYTHIDTGYINYQLRIGGSIVSTTEQPTPAANPVYVGAYASNELAAVLATINARLSTDAAPFAISTVFGADSHDRFVTSGREFQVNGTWFDLGVPGAKVELAFADGLVQQAFVKEWKPTYIRCVAPLGKEAKTCELRVTSNNGDGGVTTICKSKVPFKYEVTPPKLTKLYPYPYEGEAAYENGLIEGAEFYLHGENLTDVTEVNFTYMSTSDGMEHTKVIPAEGYEVEGGNRITVSGSIWADGWGDVWDRVADVTFEVKTEKGSATIKAHDKS